MYCWKCGAINDDSASTCAKCGAATRQGEPQNAYVPPQHLYVPSQSVPNYLAHAILVTLFCCLPLGVVAIVYAAKVDGLVAAGDYAGAVAASESAKKWCWASFLSIAALMLVYALFAVFVLIVGHFAG